MKKISFLMIYMFFLPNVSIATSNIDAAVADICKCDFPPSEQCMDRLAKKYPEINKREALQDLVMEKAEKKCGVGSDNAKSFIQDLVGNQNSGLSALLGSSVEVLNGSNSVVSSTEDCSTESFKVTVPKNWQCRRLDKNAYDVTVYNQGIDVSLGTNQGNTSCSFIPICTSENFKLSDNFDSTLFKNPLAGTYEYAGTYKNDSNFKLTITSNTKPTKAQLRQITEIMDSFEKR